MAFGQCLFNFIRCDIPVIIYRNIRGHFFYLCKAFLPVLFLLNRPVNIILNIAIAIPVAIGRRLPAADCPLPTANCRLPTAKLPAPIKCFSSGLSMQWILILNGLLFFQLPVAGEVPGKNLLPPLPLLLHQKPVGCIFFLFHP